MRWPLRLQILIPFTALMLVTLVAVSLLNAYLAAERSERQIERQLRDIARTLSDSSFPLSDVVLRQMSGLSGAEFVLTDQGGVVMAASNRLATKVEAPHAPSTDLQDLRLGPPVEIGTQRYFRMALNMNLRTARAEPTTLHILYPEEILSETRRQAAYPALIVGLIALLAAILLGVFIASRLSRPIAMLRSHFGRLAQTDFRPLALPPRNDELRDLVIAVNQLAAQLDDMRTAIQRSERLALLGQLSGGMVHHLRNDVTGARMAVQLHQRHCSADDQESLQVALRQLTLTEGHVNRFLAAGQPQRFEKIDFDLASLVQEVADLLGPALRHRKVELRIKVAEQPIAIRGDRDQLRHSLVSLVFNAAEAAGAAGWVEVGIDPQPEQVLLQVRDSGKGPPPHVANRMFEPLVTGKPEGIGLGLAAARRIAQAHDGSLEYRRDENTTCFELRIPVAPATSASNSPAAGSEVETIRA